jgi:hypothetical protein
VEHYVIEADQAIVLREVPSVVLFVGDLNDQLPVIVHVVADSGWERRFVVTLEIGLSQEEVSRQSRALSNTLGTYILERTPVVAIPVGVSLAHVLDMVALLAASFASPAAEACTILARTIETIAA